MTSLWAFHVIEIVGGKSQMVTMTKWKEEARTKMLTSDHKFQMVMPQVPVLISNSSEAATPNSITQKLPHFSTTDLRSNSRQKSASVNFIKTNLHYIIL